jgi:hypothetical protein
MYSNNKEYRQSIRNFFNMNIANIESEIKQYNYDEETEDELLFDEVAMNLKKPRAIDCLTNYIVMLQR